MPDQGIRLQLLIGSKVPKAAPCQVIDSLSSLEVTNNDRERDGFQLTFTLGRDSLAEYGLLQGGLLEPPNRLIASVTVRNQSYVLIDGVITNHQMTPSSDPGRSTLSVTGDDISLQLDLVEKNATYPNQSDSVIVQRILSSYAEFGLNPDVSETKEAPLQTDRLTTQQGTDLSFVQELAKRNGFVFYIEPTSPGESTAYFGPENRLGQPQPALSMNMGPDSNLESLNITFNALGPTDPLAKMVDMPTRQSFPVPVPSGLPEPISSQPAAPLRRTIVRNTANLNSIQAGLRTLTSANQSANAVTATGELNVVRYGRVLQARRLVSVRGVGNSNDGTYYVKQVTHRLSRGEYKLSFTLEREGQGSLSKRVIS
jgi:hypothetical protein